MSLPRQQGIKIELKKKGIKEKGLDSELIYPPLFFYLIKRSVPSIINFLLIEMDEACSKELSMRINSVYL